MMKSSKRPPTALSGENHPPYEEEFRLIGELLEQNAEQIMERWLERAKAEQTHEKSSDREEALNDLQHMLQFLGRRLQEQSDRALDEAARLAGEHGRQRFGLGWGLVNVVSDYGILHGAVLEHLGGVLKERLSYRQAMVISSIFNEAIGSAVAVFSQIAQERLEQANRELETHVKRQGAEIQQLVLDLTDAEHRERQEIAQTLHDDFQQILVAARMKLQGSARTPSPDARAVEQARELLDQLLTVSRDLAADLHPTVIDQKSLPAAIQWLGDAFRHRFNLDVTVELRVDRASNPGPLALRRLIYDSMRELLFNVVKHGRTGQAWVRIWCDDHSPWRFEIEDRGAGSSTIDGEVEQAGRTSLGLAGVRRRIQEIGGSVEVDSQPGRGTRILLTVPVELTKRAA